MFFLIFIIIVYYFYWFVCLSFCIIYPHFICMLLIPFVDYYCVFCLFVFPQLLFY